MPHQNVQISSKSFDFKQQFNSSSWKFYSLYYMFLHFTEQNTYIFMVQGERNFQPWDAWSTLFATFLMRELVR